MALLPWLKITYTFLNQLKAFIKPGNWWRGRLSVLYTAMGISTQQFGAFINLISRVYNFYSELGEFPFQNHLSLLNTRTEQLDVVH